jgi:hypothetical protein
MVDPSPTITAAPGPNRIAMNKGTCDASVALNGPSCTFKNPNVNGITIANAVNKPVYVSFLILMMLHLPSLMYIHQHAPIGCICKQRPVQLTSSMLYIMIITFVNCSGGKLMLTIEEKAFAAAKEKNGVFIIKTIGAPGGCFDNEIKDIVVELHRELKGSEKGYTMLEYEGIKVYIERYLKIHEDVRVYQRFKLPVIGGIFKVNGIEVKYM